MVTLQTKFISDCKARSIPCNVYLINGIKLNGIIAAYDDETVVLQLDGQYQLIYKHAISTVVPGQKPNIG